MNRPAVLRTVRAVLIWAGLFIWIVAGVLALRYYVSTARQPQTAAPPSPQPSPTEANRAAEAYAVQFAGAYLTFDSAHPDDYRKTVAPYLAKGPRPHGRMGR